MSGLAFWDTNVLIYWIEASSKWRSRVGALVDRQRERGLATVTSALTLGEILVHPARRQAEVVFRDYARLIREMGCLAFGPDEAERFAGIRAAYPALRPPDVIQLACAAQAGVEWFVTNDGRLSQVKVDGIRRMVCLADEMEVGAVERGCE